jgi:adenylate cyclase
MSTETTVARQKLAQRNEELVLAEATMAGQTFISAVRVVVIVAMGLSMLVMFRITGAAHTLDVPRTVGVILFSSYSVATLVYFLTRKKPLERRRIIASQFWRATIDFSFMAFMGWRQFVSDGTAFPEMGAVGCAIFLSFAVASYEVSNVLFSTAAACTSYAVTMYLVESQSGHSFFFVEAMLLCLGVTMGLTSRHVGRMFVNLRKRDNLTRFLSPQVAEHAMNLGSTALAPVQREVTVLFSDIRDFTALSETISPREVLELLDGYFGHMGQIVKGRDGIVNKFIGDGMLAFWNVPNRDEQHADHALRAALDMRTKMVELNAHRAQLGQVPLRIGIGIHTGLVAAGMLGGADQHEYTVIGDAVNVASRIEGLNKQLGTDILLSEVTYQQVKDRFACRRVGEEHVKGREQPVVVYDIQGDVIAAKAAVG